MSEPSIIRRHRQARARLSPDSRVADETRRRDYSPNSRIAICGRSAHVQRPPEDRTTAGRGPAPRRRVARGVEVTSSDEVAGYAAGLVSVGEDDPRLGPPSRVIAAPVDPQLSLLPTHAMEWPGLRAAAAAGSARGSRSEGALSLFGVSGQAQDGLDVVGLNASGEAEGVQGKRYASFGVADLDAAVAKFTAGVVAVRGSAPARRRCHQRARASAGGAGDRAQPAARGGDRTLGPRPTLRVASRASRDRAGVLRRRDGRGFCVPHRIGRVEVPGPDAVTLADAVLAGLLRLGKRESSWSRQRQRATATQRRRWSTCGTRAAAG